MSVVIDSEDAELGDGPDDGGRWLFGRLLVRLRGWVARKVSPAVAEEFAMRYAAARDRHAAELAKLRRRAEKAEAERDTAKLESAAYAAMHARMAAALAADTAAYRARGEAAAGQ